MYDLNSFKFNIRKIKKSLRSRRRQSMLFQKNLRSQRGMTMIEMIIVMSLVAGLSVLIIGAVMDGARTARASQAELGFGTIKNSLIMYKLHVKRFPTSDQGLSALVDNPGVKHWRGPYIDEATLEDPWGTPVRYEADGRKYKFTSAGDDLEFDTDDDIHYPKQDEATSH